MIRALFVIMIGLYADVTWGQAGVRIPSKIFDQLLQSSAIKEGQLDRFYFAPISVELIPVEQLGEPVRIDLSEGGGLVALEQHLRIDKWPFFNLKFSFRGEEADLKTLRVFFLGSYEPQESGSNKFGSTCGVALDLSKAFRPGGAFYSNGLELSTAQFRYLHTIGGEFYFAWESGVDTFVSRVKFEDSRAKLKECAK